MCVIIDENLSSVVIASDHILDLVLPALQSGWILWFVFYGNNQQEITNLLYKQLH